MVKTSHRKLFLFLFAIYMVFIDEAVGYRDGPLRDAEIRSHLRRLNKPAMKTIKSGHGSTIACVDIYKQPAFDHPLLKNHTIQMSPSHLPKIATEIQSIPAEQLWTMNQSCPEGTVPITRTRKSDLLRASSFEAYGKKDPSLHQNFSILQRGPTLERAGAQVEGGQYFGASANINVWAIHVEPNEYSESKIQISNGVYPNENSVQAGWIVNRNLYGDDLTRLYIYWTSDSFIKTGCYNLLCSGFVQVNSKIPMGVIPSPLSTYNGNQRYIAIKIYKDKMLSNWWYQVGESPVGYWPESIFDNMGSGSRVQFNGEALNTWPGGRHTTTQIGNGHFADEGYTRASFISNTLVSLSDYIEFVPSDGLSSFAERPECYSVMLDGKLKDDPGYVVFYGGPGIGNGCS